MKIKIIFMCFMCFIIVLFNIYFLKKNNIRNITIDHTKKNIFYGVDVYNFLYDFSNSKYYKIKAEKIIYLSKLKVSWLYKFNAIDHNKTWSISSDRARLKNNFIIDLYGHVKIQSLNKKNNFKYIETENATLHLVNQNFVSNINFTVYGNNFISKGKKMHGTLNKNSAIFFENINLILYY